MGDKLPTLDIAAATAASVFKSTSRDMSPKRVERQVVAAYVEALFRHPLARCSLCFWVCFICPDRGVMDEAYQSYYRFDTSPLEEIVGRSEPGKNLLQQFKAHSDASQFLQSLCHSEVRTNAGMDTSFLPKRNHHEATSNQGNQPVSCLLRPLPPLVYVQGASQQSI